MLQVWLQVPGPSSGFSLRQVFGLIPLKCSKCELWLVLEKKSYLWHIFVTAKIKHSAAKSPDFITLPFHIGVPHFSFRAVRLLSVFPELVLISRSYPIIQTSDLILSLPAGY